MEESQKIAELLKDYRARPDRGRQETVAELLRSLQEITGYLTPELKEMAAEAAGVPLSLIALLVRLYPSLKDRPEFHTLVLCTGPNCGPKGNFDLLARLKRKLSLSKEGFSADGSLRLQTRNCLKHCRTAPNLLFDGELYSGEEARRLLEKLLS